MQDKYVGLTTYEARRRLKEYGYNELPKVKDKSLLFKFFKSISSPLVLILILAASISFVMNYLGNENNYVEPIVIIVIIFLNIFIELFQERKSKISLSKLMDFTKPLTVVIRENKSMKILTRELVVGDLVKLETGDIVPADIQIIESNRLRIDESNLTGESIPVNKDINNDNIIHSSTIIVNGNCKGLVIKTGVHTEIGKIAELIQETEDQTTPLEIKLKQISKLIAFSATFICVLIFIIGIIRGQNLYSIFMISISLAVAAVPEGLLTVITLILSKSVQNMAQQNAIVKDLSAIETLGAVDVICTDKTGTLTQNKMTEVAVVSYDDIETNKKSIFNNFRQSNDEQKKIIKYAALCTSILENYDKNNKVGDPTEIALIEGLEFISYSYKELNDKYPKLLEIPFDSDRKIMSTIHNNSEEVLMITKGAPDEILEICKDMTVELKKNILEFNKKLASKALRVIAISYKSLPKNVDINDIKEENLQFLGLIGLIDPPKETSIEAIKLCNKLGIRTVMITGDYIYTAVEIAKQLKMIKSDRESINGEEIRNCNIDQLSNIVDRYSVYARVNPKDKLNIVAAWQNKGSIIAMIGDGVNDAPALKKANISCAMGINGTDVAKNIASLILTDDNFITIVNAVKQGRIIINNVKKTVLFLLSSNIAEIIIIFICTVLSLGMPLAPVHLLLINTLTDVFPAFALGMENIQDEIDKNNLHQLFTKKFIYIMIIQGIYIALISLCVFLVSKTFLTDGNNFEIAKTMTFATLSLSQLVHAYNCRSRFSLMKIGFFTNKFMNYSFLFSLGIIFIIILFPSLRNIFDLTELSFLHWIVIVVFSLLVFLFDEILKFLLKYKKRV